MDNNFSSLVGQANSVLVLLAKNPYLDQVAAGLSLYLALKDGQGKNVQIASSSAMMVEHNRLVGVDKVTMEPGNKNLVVRFSNYPADNIERVSYDVDGQEFRLTVIPKSQFEAPSKDQVDLSYSGVAADLVILVGGMNESHFPMLSSGQLPDSKLAHVGVQSLAMESSDKQVHSFAQGTASTSEVMYKLINEIGVNMSSDIASNLLMGMQEGTRSFSHSKVTAETFKIASDLMEKGATLDPRQAEDQKQYPPGAIPGSIQSPALPVQQPQQSVQHQNSVSQSQPQQKQISEDESNPEQEKAPQSWLQPKIYKGTSK